MNCQFDLLKRQHEEILETLTTLEGNWSQKHSQACLIQAEELMHLLQDHHNQERVLLFDRVRSRHQMREGGPFCSYYFDFFMNNRPQSRVEKIMSQKLGRDFSISIPENLQVYFQEHSLFCVPLEEHIATEALCMGLIEALAHRCSSDETWIGKSIEALRELISSNVQKEETCLWEAIRQIKDPQLQMDLAQAN